MSLNTFFCSPRGEFSFTGSFIQLKRLSSVIQLSRKMYAMEMDNPYTRKFPGVPRPPVFATVQEERVHIKQKLAGAFRVFSKLGFDEGVAGHITARDPEFPDTFWVNPFGVHFSQVKVSNLIRVNHQGVIIEGDHPVNTAAFNIHSRIHLMRPDVNAAAHTHSMYGRTWSTLGRTLDIITQDACQFYNDHVVYDDYGGVVVEMDEGVRVATALGKHKAAILQNHGLLTVGGTVDAAAWWYIAMERCCQAQLLAESTAGANGTKPKLMAEAAAEQASRLLGCEYAGWFAFQPLYNQILKEQPDFLE